MPSAQLVNGFCRLLEEELASRRREGHDLAPLKAYYRNLFRNGDRVIPAAAYGYSRRFAGLIKELDAKKRKESGVLRVMDAGCGYGSESFFFSLLGYDVTGVELVRERVELARSRVPFFQSRSAFPLRVRFENANILESLGRAEPLDVLWAMEAISHIYPPEAFLSLAYRALGPGGLLAVSDPNKANPWAFIRSARIRGGLKHAPHRRFRDPEKGTPVDYGQENVFAAAGLKRKLKDAGFQVKSVDYAGFMGTSFLPERALRIKSLARCLVLAETAARKIPLVKACGSIYTVIAVKE